MTPQAGARPRAARATSAGAPVGIFDGGIGSYDMVRRIREAFPRQDIIYLADRASFPYGALTEDELLDSVTRATEGLVRLGAGSVILASNAPSVTVLDRLQERANVPVLGVKPPVAAALGAVAPRAVVAVAGAGVMIDSEALGHHIAAEALRAGTDPGRVVPVRADALIALVESGAFLTPERVAGPVGEFVEALRREHPRLAAITLSSTHLPWLAAEFARVAPDVQLFDPADEVVREFAALVPQPEAAGDLVGGQLTCVATASAKHTLAEFQAMIDTLGLGIRPTLITL